MVSDHDLVEAAADAAKDADAGHQVAPSVISLMRAIASTRDEVRRQDLAQAAAIRAGAVGDAALQLLRVAIFALA